MRIGVLSPPASSRSPRRSESTVRQACQDVVFLCIFLTILGHCTFRRVERSFRGLPGRRLFPKSRRLGDYFFCAKPPLGRFCLCRLVSIGNASAVGPLRMPPDVFAQSSVCAPIWAQDAQFSSYEFAWVPTQIGCKDCLFRKFHHPPWTLRMTPSLLLGACPDSGSFAVHHVS